MDKPSKVRVVLGKWDISRAHIKTAKDILAEKITIHPNYSRFTLQNDIAVVKLSKEITFNQKMRPICLPPAGMDIEGELAYVTGWGKNELGKLVSKLHKLKSAIIANDLCDKRWQKVGSSPGFIANSMVCMDTQDGDSCNGDSGGPSVIEKPEGSGRYTQVGIVSFGSGSCTDKNLPGVYTRVPRFVQWIKNQISSL